MLKVTALMMLGTFVIGIAVAFTIYELGVFFNKRQNAKDKKSKL